MMKQGIQKWIAACIVASFFSVIYTPSAEAAEKKDKAARRAALMMQKMQQDMEAEKAAMQAKFDADKKKLEEALVQKDEEIIKIEKNLASAEKRNRTLEGEKTKLIAEKTALTEKFAQTEATLATTEKNLADLNAQYKQAQEDLKFNDNQRKTLSGNLAQTTKSLNQCVEKNGKLHQFGTDLIKIYDKPSSYEAAMRKETFFQLKRVELENLLQEQQDKLDEEKVTKEVSVN
jgi:chromosome segregation ATPase